MQYLMHVLELVHAAALYLGVAAILTFWLTWCVVTAYGLARPAIAPPLLQAKRFGVVWLAPWVSVYSVILPVAKPEKTR